ncbi:hypothetical protein EEJ42_35795, partial [Streptomyces botrytidirepellens]
MGGATARRLAPPGRRRLDMTQDPGGRSGEHGPRDLDWQQVADAFWLAVCKAETDRGPGRPAPGPLPAPPHGDAPPP